jgi:hypothetical protein
MMASRAPYVAKRLTTKDGSDKDKGEMAQEVLQSMSVAAVPHGIAYEPTTREFEVAATQLRATYHSDRL